MKHPYTKEKHEEFLKILDKIRICSKPSCTSCIHSCNISRLLGSVFKNSFSLWAFSKQCYGKCSRIYWNYSCINILCHVPQELEKSFPCIKNTENVS